MMVDGQPASAAGLKQKLMAWWHGYDSPALVALDGCKRAFLLWWNGDTESKASHAPTKDPGSRARVVAPLRKKQQQDINARGIVSQALWGEGNLCPGPPEFINESTARLGLTPEMSMLDLGAGLGGPARAISSAYGIWVSAFEAVPEHVKVGMEQSVMHGMGKKVPLAHYAPETVELPKRKYDCIFSKELMHLVQAKKRLIAEIEAGLKEGRGQFFIIDYVVTEKGKTSPRIAEWNEADEEASHFWTREEYAAAFAEAKLDLRVTEDQTARYCEMIAEGFRSLRKNMDNLLSEETDPHRQSELRRALAFESNRWAVRAEALQSGDIAVLRFSGLNPLQTAIR